MRWNSCGRPIRSSRGSSTRTRTSVRAPGSTELPPLDAFGTLVFQVIGQQLSVKATRTILGRLEQHFGGHLPSPAELLEADPQVLRDSGMSARKGTTLRALAERFDDGRLSDEALAGMTTPRSRRP